MGIGQVLVMALVISLLLLIFVTMIEQLVLLNMRIELGHVLRPFIERFTVMHSVEPEQLHLLKERLLDLGIVSPDARVMGSGRFGDTLTLEIQGQYRYQGQLKPFTITRHIPLRRIPY